MATTASWWEGPARCLADTPAFPGRARPRRRSARRSRCQRPALRQRWRRLPFRPLSPPQRPPRSPPHVSAQRQARSAPAPTPSAGAAAAGRAGMTRGGSSTTRRVAPAVTTGAVHARMARLLGGAWKNRTTTFGKGTSTARRPGRRIGSTAVRPAGIPSYPAAQVGPTSTRGATGWTSTPGASWRRPRISTTAFACLVLAPRPPRHLCLRRLPRRRHLRAPALRSLRLAGRCSSRGPARRAARGMGISDT
jgi:hypothetical protein